MSFHEKSAWIMGILIALVGSWYARTVIAASVEQGAAVMPSPTLIIITIGFLIFGSIIGHIFISIASGETVSDEVDERDSQVLQRSGNISGYVLGAGCITGLWHYFHLSDGNLFFHIIVISLFLAQLADYVLKIWFYRRGI